MYINPIQDNPIQGWCKALTSFSPEIPTNVRISSYYFLHFSFNLFVTQLETSNAISVTSPKLLNLNQDHLSENLFFWSNPYKIKVVITPFIENPELPNFAHMTLLTMQFQLSDKIVLMTS